MLRRVALTRRGAIDVGVALALALCGALALALCGAIAFAPCNRLASHLCEKILVRGDDDPASCLRMRSGQATWHKRLA